MPACAIVRSAAEPTERFSNLRQLVARLHELRTGRAVELRPGVLDLAGAGSTPMVGVRDAAALSDPAIAYVVIGQPALAASVQRDMLEAALREAA